MAQPILALNEYTDMCCRYYHNSCNVMICHVSMSLANVHMWHCPGVEQEPHGWPTVNIGYWFFIIFWIATLPAPEGCGFVRSLGFRTDTATESSKRTCPRPLVQQHPKPKLWLKALKLCYDWKYAVGSRWLCTPTWCNLALPYLASAKSTPRSDAAGALCCYDWVQGCFVRINLSISDLSWLNTNIPNNLLWTNMLLVASYCACAIVCPRNCIHPNWIE